MGYNDTSIHYDHTLHPKLHIIIEHFNKNTELRLTANDYYQYPQYKKVYIGEWAWFAFIKDMVPNQNMRNSIYFENNKKLYFDFNVTNKLELLKIIDILTHFNMFMWQGYGKRIYRSLISMKWNVNVAVFLQ